MLGFFVFFLSGCFIFVYVPDFLSSMICSVLNCCLVLQHLTKNGSNLYLLRRALDYRNCDGPELPYCLECGRTGAENTCACGVLSLCLLSLHASLVINW